jgi:hypothetical protein
MPEPGTASGIAADPMMTEELVRAVRLMVFMLAAECEG